MAGERGVTLRLLGGIAFRLRSPSAQSANLSRQYVDIDFVGLRKQRRSIETLFTDLGYTPRSTFNALNGLTRLIFNDIENQRRVDIFLNVFEMCHKLDFSERLKLDQLTLPLADLLLTKLQVYEITEREYKDVIALLKDHELGQSDERELINLRHIAKLAGSDWGLWRTITLNLERLDERVGSYLDDHGEQRAVREKILQLKKRIDEEPKSFGWKMRATVGEKIRWYELPEADREVVDSRPATERMGDDGQSH